jgi:hypothetical protein
VQLAEGDEIGSLEDVLLESLKDATSVGDVITNILSELAYDHWLELFEALGPNCQRISSETMSLYWQIGQSLEQNADVANYLGNRPTRQGHGVPSTPDWQILLTRVQRRVELLRATPLRLSRSFTPLVASASRVGSKKVSRMPTLNSASGRSGIARRENPDENQRALDRVSYLGGILLPFPVVSGVLSMGDTFGPEGSLFFIFWAVSIPMAALAVLIIYADTLRKAEVWVEIAAETVRAGTIVFSRRGSSDEPEIPSQRSDEVPIEIIRKTKIYRPMVGRPVEPSNGQPGDPNSQPLPLPPVTYTVEEEEEIIEAPRPQALPDTGDEIQEVGPDMIIERPSDGSQPKAWKRQQLGWYGAVKAIVGYYKPRRAEDTPVGIAAYERPQKKPWIRRDHARTM